MKSILYNLMIMYFAFSYVLNANAQTDLKRIESLFNEGKYEEVVMKSKSINPQTPNAVHPLSRGDIIKLKSNTETNIVTDIKLYYEKEYRVCHPMAGK